jgi:hypothetical protein
MNLKNVVVTLISALLLLSGLSAQAAADTCLYNPDSISPERYLKNDEFKNVQWNADTKIALIQTKHSEPLTIKHWACSHFGIEAELKVRRSLKSGGQEQEEKYLTEKVKWLSKVILDMADQAKLDEAIQSKKFKTQLRSMIAGTSDETILFAAGDYYAQMTLHLITEAGSVVINLHVELD